MSDNETPEQRRKRKAREYSARYRAENPEKVRAWRNAHNAKNRERERTRAKAWYETNNEQARATRREYYRNNRDRLNELNDRWKEKNREKQRWYHIKSKYAVTREQYEKMLADQDGVCAICLEPPAEGWFLHVDHCHTSKAFRGLLCQHCNQGLGHYRDDPERLRRAAAYLEEVTI